MTPSRTITENGKKTSPVAVQNFPNIEGARPSAFPTAGVFDRYFSDAYPYRFEGTLHVKTLAGGTPMNPKVTESWLRTKIQDSDDIIRQAVAEVMVETGQSAEEATETVVKNQHLNGFKRDPQRNGELYIEGRQLKSAIKEAANVRWPKQRWGVSSKGTLGFFAEHVFVVEDRLYLGVTEPTAIVQRFVHTWRGHGIQNEEVVEGVNLDFTIITDHDFKRREWGLLWNTGGQQGIGASRSQGFGRYLVTKWDKADKDGVVWE